MTVEEILSSGMIPPRVPVVPWTERPIYRVLVWRVDSYRREGVFDSQIDARAT